MLIKTIPVGMLSTNCYIAADDKTLECAIIDPGAESNVILDYIEGNSLSPAAIFLTHGHFDHSMALEAILEAFNVPVYVSEKDVDRSGNDNQFKVENNKNMTYCSEGDVIKIGDVTFTVMETPGHSPGSITLMCDEAGNKQDAALFTGDTLFCGDCGRTDLPGGDREVILSSLRRLAELSGDYEVYPGHDETTTLDKERRYNLDISIATGEVT